MKSDKFFSNKVKKVVEKFVRVDANSTTCILVYQPKAPAALKKYSKTENDN